MLRSFQVYSAVINIHIPVSVYFIGVLLTYSKCTAQWSIYAYADSVSRALLLVITGCWDLSLETERVCGVCVEGTPVLTLNFPGSFLFRYEWCFQLGIIVHTRWPLCEVGVKSDSPFMFIHIPPACITGMQKLTFFPPEDQTRHSFFFLIKTNLNSPFICLVGDASLCVFLGVQGALVRGAVAIHSLAWSKGTVSTADKAGVHVP